MIIKKTKTLVNKRYQVISKILNKIPPESIGVELGVWSGELSLYLLSIIKNIKKIYLIDPWKKYNNEEYIDSINDCDQEYYNCIYNCLIDNISKNYPKRAEVLRGISEDFENKFQDNSLNFIYIDANNLYDQVIKDIEIWYPKLKSGGILFGNNFIEDGYYVWQKDSNGNPICYGEYGVKSAVRVFCKKNNISYQALDENQWLINK